VTVERRYDLVNFVVVGAAVRFLAPLQPDLAVWQAGIFADPQSAVRRVTDRVDAAILSRIAFNCGKQQIFGGQKDYASNCLAIFYEGDGDAPVVVAEENAGIWGN
jgi:hypothetical protein